jgi:hypothetical protein
MPRVTNQKVRQYMLETGEALDVLGPLPDKVQLFDSEGEPLALTGSQLYAGPGDPDISVGAIGDFWLDTDSNAFWQKVDSELEPEIGEWEQIALLSGTWSVAVDYPAGSIVRHSGKTYGIAEDIAAGGVAPDYDPSSNWGAPIKGIQAKTTGLLDNEVDKTFDYSTALLDSGSKYAVALGLDFVTSWSDVTLRVNNQTDSVLQLFIDDAATGGTGTAAGTANAGVSTDIPVNVDGWAGTSGEYVLLLNDFNAGARPIGTVTVTVLAGANDLNPAPAGNPWVEL